MKRKEKSNARIIDTMNTLKKLIEGYGPIESVDDVRDLCRKHSDVSLHFFNTKHKLVVVSPEYWLSYKGHVVENFSDYDAMKTITESLKKYVPSAARRINAIIVQVFLGVVAFMATRDLPAFWIICKTNNPYLKEKLKTEFFEACLYGEHIFSSKNKPVGTLIITNLYPIENYGEKNYEEDKNTMSPPVSWATSFVFRNLFDIGFENARRVISLIFKGNDLPPPNPSA